MLLVCLLAVATIAEASHGLSENKMNQIQMLSAGDKDTLQVSFLPT
jgi:hypothetical protein